jgi:RNA polymerase sigma-70 factor (ECF subfamily)
MAVPEPAVPPLPSPSEESSLTLLERACHGDAQAVDALARRYAPRLQRWARGRLPASARALSDTQDIVQDTIVRTFRRIEAFEVRGEGAFQAYLHQALRNRIAEEVRYAGRRPTTAPMDASVPDEAASPLELAIGQDTVRRYEAGLARLRPEDREVIIARVELGMTNHELAEAFAKPTPDAARVALKRALLRLAREMRA